jgi:hypothetical protein
MTKRTEIETVLNELVHACEDSIDNYGAISDACDKAKLLIPSYSEDKMLFDEWSGERLPPNVESSATADLRREPR